MPRPSSFITSTDYPTLKNDGTTTTDPTVTIPASASIPGNSYLEYHTDITIGVKGAISLCRISSTADSNKWYQAQIVTYTRVGTNSGLPAAYAFQAFIYRASATTVRCQVLIPNPYSTTTTGAASETITFHVNTFLPPFS